MEFMVSFEGAGRQLRTGSGLPTHFSIGFAALDPILLSGCNRRYGCSSARCRFSAVHRAWREPPSKPATEPESQVAIAPRYCQVTLVPERNR